MKLCTSRDDSSGSSGKESDPRVEATGYRLIDLNKLSSVLSMMHICGGGKPVVHVIVVILYLKSCMMFEIVYLAL